MSHVQTFLKEFCAENFTDIPKAIAAGARRIELCDNLAAGGTTPSRGVIQKTLSYARAHDTATMVMIRPRGGNFEYTADEVEIMLTDIALCQELQVDGVVFGCLQGSWIDEEAITALLDAAKGLSVTFHMAFDSIEKERQFAAIDWLSQRGVSRVLTRGGPACGAIEDHIEHLQALVAYAQGKLCILPGGGIHHQNAERILTLLGLTEVHGTKIVAF